MLNLSLSVVYSVIARNYLSSNFLSTQYPQERRLTALCLSLCNDVHYFSSTWYKVKKSYAEHKKISIAICMNWLVKTFFAFVLEAGATCFLFVNCQRSMKHLDIALLAVKCIAAAILWRAFNLFKISLIIYRWFHFFFFILWILWLTLIF